MRKYFKQYKTIIFTLIILGIFSHIFYPFIFCYITNEYITTLLSLIAIISIFHPISFQKKSISIDDIDKHLYDKTQKDILDKKIEENSKFFK